jgi:hypothetical protein
MHLVEYEGINHKFFVKSDYIKFCITGKIYILVIKLILINQS